MWMWVCGEADDGWRVRRMTGVVGDERMRAADNGWMCAGAVMTCGWWLVAGGEVSRGRSATCWLWQALIRARLRVFG